MMPVCVAWCGHNDASRELAEDLRDAMKDVCGSEKAAAIKMGLTPNQLSRQLAGREPFNAFRLGYLPVTFMPKFLKRRADRIGAAVVTAEERELIRAALTLGKKRMARLCPQLVHHERKRA